MKKIYFLPILLTLLLFSCQKEHLDGEFPDAGRTEVNMIAENGLDLTPFLHLDDDRLDILKGLVFPPSTRTTEGFEMDPNSVEIPGLGQTRTFKLYGKNMADNVDIIVREIYDDEIARVTLTDAGDHKEGQIYFPPYTNIAGQSRVYIIEYSENGAPGKILTVVLQNPVDASFLTNLSTFNYSISKGGGLVTIYKDGTYPAVSGDYMEFRFAVNQDPDNVISTVTLDNVSQRSIDIPVPVNNGEARSLTLYYRSPDSDWVILDHCVQLGGTGGGEQVSDWFVARTSSDPVTVYGGTVIVALKGNFNSMEVRLRSANSNGEFIVTEPKTLYAGNFPPIPTFDFSPYDGAIALQLPLFEDNGWAYNLDRRYLHHSGNSFVWVAEMNTGSGWKLLSANTHGSNQIPQPWNRIKLSEYNSIAPSGNSSWPVEVSGYWENQTSNKLVRLWMVTDPDNPAGTVVSIVSLNPLTMSAPATRVQLAIPVNKTKRSRKFYLLFSLDEGRTFNKWYPGWNGDGSITQDPSR